MNTGYCAAVVVKWMVLRRLSLFLCYVAQLAAKSLLIEKGFTMKRFLFPLTVAMMLLPLLAMAQQDTPDNRLTRAERQAGWQLLFNGENYDGWKNNNDAPIASQVEDGCMQTNKCGGYILTYDKEFANFILKCDVKMDTVCNSGIFLRMENLKDPVNTGFEIQVLTDKPDSKPTVNSNASLYDVKAVSKNTSKGAGEWDQFEIKFVGKKLSIKLNDEEILTADLEDYKEPGKRDVPGNHKFVLDGKPRALNDFAVKGYIGFQDHGDKCWYKNVKILELDDEGNAIRPQRQPGANRPAATDGTTPRTRGTGQGGQGRVNRPADAAN